MEEVAMKPPRTELVINLKTAKELGRPFSLAPTSDRIAGKLFLLMSAFGGKAEMPYCTANVCF
jgi:hypothetical protein